MNNKLMHIKSNVLETPDNWLFCLVTVNHGSSLLFHFNNAIF